MKSWTQLGQASALAFALTSSGGAPECVASVDCARSSSSRTSAFATKGLSKCMAILQGHEVIQNGIDGGGKVVQEP